MVTITSVDDQTIETEMKYFMDAPMNEKNIIPFPMDIIKLYIEYCKIYEQSDISTNWDILKEHGVISHEQWEDFVDSRDLKFINECYSDEDGVDGLIMLLEIGAIADYVCHEHLKKLVLSKMGALQYKLPSVYWEAVQKIGNGLA